MATLAHLPPVTSSLVRLDCVHSSCMSVLSMSIGPSFYLAAQASHTGVHDAAGNCNSVRSSGSHLNSQRKCWSIHHAPRGSSCTSATRTGAQSVERSREGDGSEGAGSTQTGRGGAVHAHLEPVVGSWWSYRGQRVWLRFAWRSRIGTTICYSDVSLEVFGNKKELDLRSSEHLFGSSLSWVFSGQRNTL